MKLGKKLEVTDKKERLKLLIDGEVFYTKLKSKIHYDDRKISEGLSPFRLKGQHLFGSLDVAWYYLVKTYTINGVELEDNRLSYEESCNSEFIYIASAGLNDYYKRDSISGWSVNAMERMCDRSLVHSTKESAIAHTKAMIKVAEQ